MEDFWDELWRTVQKNTNNDIWLSKTRYVEDGVWRTVCSRNERRDWVAAAITRG
jgi:hypothetical protein